GLKIGRMLSGPFGTSYLDTVQHADRIIWTPSMLASGPWSTVFKYTKGFEGDGLTPTVGGVANTVTDQDSDGYEFDLFHKGESGLAFSRIYYTDDQRTANRSVETWGLTVGGNYKLATLYINAEVDYKWGDDETEGAASIDIDKLAAFAQVGTKMGALDLSGMYFYASGDDGEDADEDSAVGALGNEFEPYYIMTGSHAGLFNGEVYAIDGDATNAGIHSLGVHANYAMSEKLMLHGAAAYHMAADEQATWDDELGIEYNVGAAYKLLDNMTYEVHFGWLDTGDFFKGANSAGETEDVWLASNHLTMTF
ncbi:MAG TPA: hypothetical protein VNT26_12985, partial [Candidatus Sulfotelmatobacter sp.]|nr:hypothetical protein [Candidatus Sulfotelmatobacter sp.]